MVRANFFEKRSYPRFPVDVALYYSIPERETFSNSRTHDICSRGLCLFSDRELPAGANVDLHLKMPDDESRIYRKGRVIWSRPVDDGKYRVGVKLEDPVLKPIPIVLRTLIAQNDY